MLFDDYKLSDEEHNQVLTEIRGFVFEDKTPVAHPQVYILGGQPGAGKSVLTESVIKNLGDDNIISINATAIVSSSISAISGVIR
ncbi:MAG: zeta toxin family protein [Alphaproteobacteria bacterium]|nr:zeta toxin family protein [Alphaproteobacteria bacterium]